MPLHPPQWCHCLERVGRVWACPPNIFTFHTRESVIFQTGNAQHVGALEKIEVITRRMSYVHWKCSPFNSGTADAHPGTTVLPMMGKGQGPLLAMIRFVNIVLFLLKNYSGVNFIEKQNLVCCNYEVKEGREGDFNTINALFLRR